MRDYINSVGSLFVLIFLLIAVFIFGYAVGLTHERHRIAQSQVKQKLDLPFQLEISGCGDQHEVSK